VTVDKALEQCLRIAVKAHKGKSSVVIYKRAHTAAAAITGAIGGFFGLPGLLVELPITTTVMLHSIVEIARSQGEDFLSPESGLACLEVFALGPQNTHREANESAYYVNPDGVGTGHAGGGVLRYPERIGKRERAGPDVVRGQDCFEIWS